MPDRVNFLPTLEEIIPYRVSRLANALASQAAVLLATETHITVGQWRVLVFIGAEWANTSRDIVAVSQYDPGFVSRMLKLLEKDGFVESRRDQDDRRVHRIVITEKGEDLFKRIEPLMGKRFRYLNGVLSEEEMAQFFDMLSRLEKAANSRHFDQM
ncbi:MAG: MarR family winged helix-turn-helix transcriptional regulator [Pikeienuella sp.]